MHQLRTVRLSLHTPAPRTHSASLGLAVIEIIQMTHHTGSGGPSGLTTAGFLSVGSRPAARSDDCFAEALPLPLAISARSARSSAYALRATCATPHDPRAVIGVTKTSSVMKTDGTMIVVDWTCPVWHRVAWSPGLGVGWGWG